MAEEDNKNMVLGDEITEYLQKEDATLEGFKKLFEEGNYDVNARNADEETGRGTSLTWAAVCGHKEIVEYLVEQGAQVEQANDFGTTPLMYAAASGNKEIFDYLVENGADIDVKDNEGMGITKYYSGELAREYRKQQKEAYAGNLWKDIQKHATVSVCDGGVRYAGYAVQSGEISIGKYMRSEPDEVMGRKSVNDEKVDGDICLIKHPFENMMTLVHEGNHRLNYVFDGMEDGNFTAEQSVKIGYCTEAIAHTSECLAVALQYQKMKDAGIKTYQYQDSKGKFQEIPIEDLLENYSPELKEYVTKKGFNPKKKKDVEAVTEIGLQYWENRASLYAWNGGQFDRLAMPVGTGEGVSQEEFDALINRMCEGVVIGDGVELDLRKYADRFNGMTDEEAQVHVSRANGEDKEDTENTEDKEDTENVTSGVNEGLSEELKEQKGEEATLDPAGKAKQMRFEMRVDKNASSQENANEGKGKIEPAKRDAEPLDLARANAQASRA